MIKRETLLEIMREIRKLLGNDYEVKSQINSCCTGCMEINKEKYFIAKTYKIGFNKSNDFNNFKKMLFIHDGIDKELFDKMSEMVKERFNLKLTWSYNDNECIELEELKRNE